MQEYLENIDVALGECLQVGSKVGERGRWSVQPVNGCEWQVEENARIHRSAFLSILRFGAGVTLAFRIRLFDSYFEQIEN